MRVRASSILEIQIEDSNGRVMNYAYTFFDQS